MSYFLPIFFLFLAGAIGFILKIKKHIHHEILHGLVAV